MGNLLKTDAEIHQQLADESSSVENPQQLAAYSTSDVAGRTLPQLVAESSEGASACAGLELFAVPWGHVRLLIDKCKGDRGKALFYARKTPSTRLSPTCKEGCDE